MHQLGVSSEKLLIENIEETYGRHNLIIPYMNPLSAISWIATRTLSNSGKGVSPSFLFYENRFGYHFKSIEKLFKNDTAIKYTYTPKNVEKTETIEQEYHDVIKYEFMNVFDIIKSTTSGMFSGVLKGIDLVRLRADDTVLDYEENFNNTVHVENDLITKIEDRKTPYPFYNKNEDRLKNSTTKNYFAFRRMYPTNSGHDTLSSIRSKQPSIIPNLVEKWMLQRSSRLSQLNYFKLKLLAPGDTLVTTGDIIEFRVPLMARKVKGELNENPYYSGRYMVTAIRHIMNTSKYEMIIEATRDCLSTAYKDADNTNPDVIEIKRQ
jgi:hypothetical protein